MKEKTIFFCTECGYESAKWLGKCPGCNSWNTMVEQRVTKTTKVFSDTAPKSTPKKIKEIEAKRSQEIK